MKPNGETIGMDLLYEGEDYKIASSFTISMDLSNYKAVYIVTDSKPFVSSIDSNGNDEFVFNDTLFKGNLIDGSKSHYWARKVMVSSTSIVFGQLYLFNINTNAVESWSQAYLYPLKIYGIK